MTAQGRKRTRNAVVTLRRRALGIGMILAIALFCTATIAIYQKAFTPGVDVTLRTPSTGNQLRQGAEVKVRGVTVGRVEEIRATATGAELDLSLERDRADVVPANATAKLLPNTLFGERHVELEIPEAPSAAPIASGAVIEQGRSRAAIELETVLADTMPVLRAVRPADLATTLNSLSMALDGRGRTMGETISRLDSYVARLPPSLPDLRANLREMVGVAKTYEQAAPDVLAAMENLSTTARTLVEQRHDLDRMTTRLTTGSQDLAAFFRASGDDLIRLNAAQRPTLDLLAKYAPQYPCLLANIVEFKPAINEVAGAGTDEPGVHITVEVVAHRGKYVPGQDEPEYADERGPRCHEMVRGRAPQYPPDGPIEDGSEPTPPPREGGELGLANSPAERDLVAGLLAPSMSTRPREVPQWGSVLLGPVFRGVDVVFR
ncbi:MCE family protein [Parasphingorhabdus pacifica]